MKMHIDVTSPRRGVIREILVQTNQVLAGPEELAIVTEAITN